MMPPPHKHDLGLGLIGQHAPDTLVCGPTSPRPERKLTFLVCAFHLKTHSLARAFVFEKRALKDGPHFAVHPPPPSPLEPLPCGMCLWVLVVHAACTFPCAPSTTGSSWNSNLIIRAPLYSPAPPLCGGAAGLSAD